MFMLLALVGCRIRWVDYAISTIWEQYLDSAGNLYIIESVDYIYYTRNIHAILEYKNIWSYMSTWTHNRGYSIL